MYTSAPDPSQSKSADSWIDISSRPSNSALSSAAPDEIDTTGLRIQRRAHTSSPWRQDNPSPLQNDGPPSAGGGSSQDEYEESESESDRIMTSSNEGFPLRASSTASESPMYEEGNDSRNATAFDALTDQQCFTPQPNAFSHPPSSSSRHRASAPGSYFPASHPVPSSQRHSFPGNHQRQHHSPYNVTSPQYQADHDAALRASLTTLLSCAAAARSLPKKTHEAATSTATRAPQGPSSARVDTTTLRMVPESVALGSRPVVARSESQHEASQAAQTQRQRRLSIASQHSTSPRNSSPIDTTVQTQHDKYKRKATTNAAGTARSNSKDRRLSKKPRQLLSSSFSGNGAVDPTLLTWVVSAGVLVLVSAISFSAGYVTGREAGMTEASVAGGAGGSLRDGAARGCGREVGRGLRRLRWSAATGSVRA